MVKHAQEIVKQIVRSCEYIHHQSIENRIFIINYVLIISKLFQRISFSYMPVSSILPPIIFIIVFSHCLHQCNNQCNHD